MLFRSAIQGNRLYTLGDLDGVEHVIAMETATGKRIWAVQPTPVARLLDDRITSEFKSLDKDQNGKIDELEALSRFGWEFNRFDKSAGGEAESRLKARAKAILEQGDSNKDGTLSYEEAGRLFRDRFGAIDLADAKGDAAAIAAKRVAGYLKALDKDGDQKVSRNESRGSWLEPQFNRIDKKVEGTDKGDEQLDVKELEEFLTKNDAGKDGVLSAQELEEFYIKSRAGGDGQLTKEELRGPFGGFRNDIDRKSTRLNSSH